MMKSWITLILIRTVFPHNPLSASAAARFHFPLSSICSRNSLLPFQGLPTSLKITASLHVMGFCIILASSLPMKLQKKTKKKRKKDNKYNYEIDFSSALKTARKFFSWNWSNPFRISLILATEYFCFDR